MADVLFFHHVLGRTPGFMALADRIRQAGHTVRAPDLFDGRTFDTIDDGIAHVQEVGFGTIIERGIAETDELPTGLVYAGVSLGVLPAQCLAQTRAGAVGAILLESCVSVSEFGVAWPTGVPVQIHGMDRDPSFVGEGDIDAARALVESADDAELFLYPGDGHLFADSGGPSYDEAATALLIERVLVFLGGC